jgi:hypothetical protein
MAYITRQGKTSRLTIEDLDGTLNYLYTASTNALTSSISASYAPNFANTNLTFTASRTHNLGTNQLTFQVSGGVGQYIVGNATRNFYVNQTDAGKTGIFVQSTTGWAIDVLSANGTAVKIESGGVGLNSKGNTCGGFFAPLSAGGAGIQTVQDVGAYALKTTGKINSNSLPTYANNESAVSGGLAIDDEYKTATGERRIVV